MATTARERYEQLRAAYVAEGAYCIGRDACWPLDLAVAYREAVAEGEAAIRG